MNVPQDTLNAWRAFAETVRTATFRARHQYAQGRREEARHTLGELHDAAICTALDMEQAGADRPGSLPQASAVPLELLSTEKSRAYADAIRRAYDLAVEVDRERGYGNDGPAWALRAFVEAAAIDAYGPAGRLRE